MSLSLSQVSACSLPPGWDSRAFCSNLHDACHYKGLKYASKCKVGLSRVFCNWKAGKRKESLQSVIYKALCKTVDGAHVWAEFLNEKLGILVGETCNNKILLRTDLVVFINGFRRCPSSSQTTSIFKTLINSWATTYRYHESIKFPCIFGCTNSEDSLQHYLCCSPMWTLAASCASLPTVFLSLSPSERLCLFNVNAQGLRLLGVVYRGYHALKLGHRDKIEQCIALNDFSAVNVIFSEICRDIWLRP